MKKVLPPSFPLIGLPLLSLIILLSAWWIPWLSVTSLVGFVPLLLWINAKQEANTPRIRQLGNLWCFHAVLTLGTLSWLFEARQPLRAVLAILAFATIASFFWYAISRAIRKLSPLFAGVALTSLAILHDYFHLHTSLGFPAYSLGNYFRHSPALIQWYSYTGILGGTALIAISNYLVFHWLTSRPGTKAVAISLTVTCLLFCLSAVTFIRGNTSGSPLEVAVLHTDYDCYGDKHRITIDSMAGDLIRQLKAADLQTTELIVLPETALNEGEWLENVDYWPVSHTLKEYLNNYAPNALLLTGGIFHQQYYKSKAKKSLPLGVDFSATAGSSYYNFNAIVAYANEQPSTYRPKRWLVPFEETVPYANALNLRHFLPERFSGYVCPAPRVRSNTTFAFPRSSRRTGSLICYEAAFGHQAASMARAMIGAIAIHTNEGWFEGASTAKEFAAFSRLRAIENRKPVVRSSNRGISAVYDQFGRQLVVRSGKDASVLRATVNYRKGATVYGMLGDYLGWLAAIALLVSLASTVFKK